MLEALPTSQQDCVKLKQTASWPVQVSGDRSYAVLKEQGEKGTLVRNLVLGAPKSHDDILHQKTLFNSSDGIILPISKVCKLLETVNNPTSSLEHCQPNPS